MALRILLLGPVPAETLAALESLPGGTVVLPPAEAHELLSRISVDQPDLVVEGAHAVDWTGSAGAFQRILENEFGRAVRYRHPLSILVVGIDGTKTLSATHGDEGVARFRDGLAEMLRRSLRKIDVVAPIATDEVAILLPETNASGARNVAERARALASRLIVKSGSSGDRHALPIKSSVSVGLCDAPQDGLGSAEAFLQAARTARRSGEQAGGDRTELAAG